MTRFAFTNRNPSTGSTWSPWRTRPLPLTGFTSPGATACSPGADAPVPRAPGWSGHPCDCLHPEVGLVDPVVDGLCRGLKFPGEFLGRSPGTDQFDHPALKFQGIRGT